MRVGRPRRPRSLEREFWEQVRLWGSWEDAGAAVGVCLLRLPADGSLSLVE
jgi:hypothetical protein